MTEPSLPRAGWYDDVANPGRDRWWDGDDWTAITARKSRYPLFGIEYERATRSRSSPFARAARVLSLISTGITVAIVIAIPTSLATVQRTVPATPNPWAVPILVLLGGAVLAGVASWVLSVVALSTSRKRGAFVISLWNVIFGALFMVGLAAITIFFVTVAPKLVP